ncbi:hypothetical protein [Bradyrhizobium erythrophlei]|uniref:hypothetical protein n=1 Tax=Bradyrhizobium erythrophlei TaxID=1437360 RepID=UPI0012AB5B41|nr:hypothetical protein [Bradyrhizobium erythrophlei]
MRARIASRDRRDGATTSPGTGSDETSFLVHETILASLRKRQETNVGQTGLDDQQWSSIMSALLTLIYRAYCKACLAEMQKHYPGS